MLGKLTKTKFIQVLPNYIYSTINLASSFTDTKQYILFERK